MRPEGVTTATKTYLPPKDIPQAIDTVEVSKSKSYGINDLSIMLDGVPGVSTAYDMRGEGITIRGFEADNNDIFRDGIRESGQVRRSTANVERIEILKGPASVLYGRGSGGGIINMISKQARFDAGSSVSLRGGSWQNVGGTVDVNHVLNRHVAMRLTADREQAHSFRHGIRNRNTMCRPVFWWIREPGCAGWASTPGTRCGGCRTVGRRIRTCRPGCPSARALPGRETSWKTS